ncbi:MAG: DUF4230 domain-containing protein [Chloroflexota bacterium]
MLRKLVYVFLIIFFALGSFAAYTFVRGVQTVDEGVIEPVGDLVRQLVLPVTPEILPNPTTIVLEIKDLARLETASFELEKVVTAESNQDVFWGALGESMVFVAHGKVIAGVDMAAMRADDLRVVDPKTVWVHLPEAKIFDDLPVLDNDRSYVADRDTGLFTSADPELETAVRREAEDAIIEAAQSGELLGRANENAEAYMRNFLQGLGFEEIVFMDETPPEPPAYEQQVPKGFAVTPVAP